MEGTSSTPHLLTDVRFSVSRKGYDPDEVDNFLERVSGAVAQLQDKLRQAAAQAESAEVRATEASRALAPLQQRVQELEAELAAAREGAPGPVAGAARSPEDEAEQISKVLVLAQRTADAAIDEANATARTTLADARSQATSLVNDAQEEAHRVLSQAHAEAEAIVTRRRETLAEEVRGLESVRDDITADLATLEAHAGDQRAAMQSAIIRLQAVLDDPSGFRLGASPAISGSSVDDVLAPDSEAIPEPEAVPEPEDASQSDAYHVDDAPAALDEPEDDADEPEVPDFVAVNDTEPTDGAEPADEADRPGPDSSGPSTEQVPPVDVVFDEEEPTSAVPSAGNLFGTPPENADDSPLGPPDDEADAAMRAFFEAEFDDDPGRGTR
jgi:DivIVA domain-containing protein